MIGPLGRQDAGWHDVPKTEGPRSKAVTIRTAAFKHSKNPKFALSYVLCTNLRTNSGYFPK